MNQNPDKLPARKWLRQTEIAAWLGVSTKAVRDWTQRRGFPVRRVDNSRFYHIGEVSRWLKAQGRVGLERSEALGEGGER